MWFVARICLLTCAFAVTGCGKKEAKLPPEAKPGDTPGFGSKSGPPGGIQPPGGGSGGGGGASLGGIGGGVQAGRGAVKRTATNNELTQIRLFIENASAATGQMPPADVTFKTLQKEAPKIAEAITEGVIVLVLAKSREDVWAYEAVALQVGGQVVTSSGIERMDAATLKQRLGMK